MGMFQFSGKLKSLEYHAQWGGRQVSLILSHLEEIVYLG